VSAPDPDSLPPRWQAALRWGAPALTSLRQILEAISHFSAIVNAKPTWAGAQFYLGLCLLDQPGKRDEGLGHLREAVRLNPGNIAWQAMLQGALKGH
jgi:tetratricopeptide (TPR) repeat protein